MKAFVIDVALCNGCYACQIACKDEHVANDWSPIAKPQPDTGQFWLRLSEHIRGTVPKVKMHYVPHLCTHCAEASCMKACPVEGVIYQREDGIIIVDPEKCTGCRACEDICSALFFNEDLNIAQKCTGCSHLIDSGEWDVPRCVDSCPTEAIKYGEEADLAELIAKAKANGAECACGPRVYYLNIPKKFIGGTVYDPVEEEVVIGATCTLKDSAGKSSTAQTDDFGDFWFEGLADDTYALTIAAKGFATKAFDEVSTEEKDVNLGDIPLDK